MKCVSGKLEMRIRYSNTLVIILLFPHISKQRKQELTQCTLNIIDND